jgi:hypothetical protein
VIKQQMAATWRELPAEERKAYRRAPAKRRTDQLLPGWSEEVVDDRTVWTHAESGALCKQKPLVRARVLAAVARRGGKLGAYAQFVKDNFKELGSMHACAAEWKARKANIAN